jgi:hypothetical protein
MHVSKGRSHLSGLRNMGYNKLSKGKDELLTSAIVMRL